MRKLISKAVLCSDWAKIGFGVALIVIGLMLPGCGTISGVGNLLNGIGSDLQNASTGYSKEQGK